LTDLSAEALSLPHGSATTSEHAPTQQDAKEMPSWPRRTLDAVCLRVGAGDSCPADLHKTNSYSIVEDSWSIRRSAV